jgi:hypothetical protein
MARSRGGSFGVETKLLGNMSRFFLMWCCQALGSVLGSGSGLDANRHRPATHPLRPSGIDSEGRDGDAAETGSDEATPWRITHDTPRGPNRQ